MITDHFSGPGSAIGPQLYNKAPYYTTVRCVCVCVCVSVCRRVQTKLQNEITSDLDIWVLIQMI